MTQQLPLPVNLRDEASFTNFYLPDKADAGSRTQINYLLKAMAADETVDTAAGSEPGLALGAEFAVYIWGPAGSGKSHLAQACCRQFVEAERRAMYLPLEELITYPPQQVLADLEHNELVCIDDLHLIMEQVTTQELRDRQAAWQLAVFDLYNRLRDKGGRLLLVGSASPGNSAIALADLQSRLAAATGFALAAYSDKERVDILCFRAQRLGLSLPEEVARYLVNRAPRDMDTLIEYLRRLDKEALAGQRRLTVPFVKTVFEY